MNFGNKRLLGPDQIRDGKVKTIVKAGISLENVDVEKMKSEIIPKTFLCQNVEKSNTSFPLRSLTKSFETIKSHLEDCPLDQSKRSKTSAHPVSSQLTILKAKKAKTLVITFLVLFFHVSR